jgi:ferredoxin-type protein NapG
VEYGHRLFEWAGVCLSENVPEFPQGRRAIFRYGLRRLMKPVAEYIEQRFDRLDAEFDIDLPVEREVLRPPGALPEGEFLDRCYRCGNCVDVCPARAIKVATGENIECVGTPYIEPSLAACVVCDELACMKACPSGALTAVEDPKAIRMGVARVDASLCVRSRGEDCRVCVERCPFGSEAIDISDGGEVFVEAEGCVGCGTCEFYCPTGPKAICVEPL